MKKKLVTFILGLCFVLGLFPSVAFGESKKEANTLNVSVSMVWNGHTYELYDEGVTWTEAKAYCEMMGGYLACITTESEQEALTAFLLNGQQTYYWLGGTDAEQEGQWRWLSGEDWDYANWGGNNPNNNGNTEHYLGITKKTTGWADTNQWNDFTDSAANSPLSEFGFVCEYGGNTSNQSPNSDGIHTFHGMVLNGIAGNPDYGTDNDAALMYVRLCDNQLSNYSVDPDNIHTFSYSDTNPASPGDVEHWISYSFANTDDDDLSVFYYTGHSTWNGHSASNYGISLSNNQFYTWRALASYLAEHIRGTIVVIMDACFSENFATVGISSLSRSERTRFSVLTACSELETSRPKNVAYFRNLPYGRFTYAIGQGIGFTDGNLYADVNHDNRVTLRELYDYVDAKLPKVIGPMHAQLLTDNENLVVFEYGNFSGGGRSFSDVSGNAYYSDAVSWAVALGVTNGTSEVTFSPDSTVTRAQAVTFIWRAMGMPEPSALESPFGDVTPDAYFYKAVLWAAEQGITNGVTTTEFKPHNPLTRAHIITFIWRTEGRPQDNESSVWYADAVQWAKNEDLLSETADSFGNDGQSYCSRSDTVYYLWKDFAC